MSSNFHGWIFFALAAMLMFIVSVSDDILISSLTFFVKVSIFIIFDPSLQCCLFRLASILMGEIPIVCKNVPDTADTIRSPSPNVFTFMLCLGLRNSFRPTNCLFGKLGFVVKANHQGKIEQIPLEKGCFYTIST